MSKKLKTKPEPVETQEAAQALPAEKLTRIDTLIALMAAPGGASIAMLQAATGWQAHSIRGAIAGSIKKRRHLDVISEKTAQGRIYRIGQEAGA